MTTEPGHILDRLRRAAPATTVIGDVMLDRWLHGSVERLSREAPVPVVEAGDVEDCAGGAANTALNLAAMGARVRLVSVVSDDDEGHALLRLLREAGVDTSGVVQRTAGITSSKTRIVGGDQILVRVDRSTFEPLGDGDRARFESALAATGDEEAVLVCDYGSGLLDAGVIDRLRTRPRPAHLLVDAHDLTRWAPLAPDVATPNAGETERLLGTALSGPARVDAVGAAASRVLAAAGARAAVVTLDREGSVVLEAGEVTGRTVARPAPESQTTGAGDTFAAALAIALSLDADLPSAARFAQRAADVVVSRPGTAVCSLDDLGAGGAADGAATVDLHALRARLAEVRRRGGRVVFTNGCFDVIHLGHTLHLRQAKDLADVLVVALNDDDSVRRLKGPGRPVNPMSERAAVLAALGCVDYVITFAEDSPSALLDELRPEIYAKGGDYTPDMLAETEVVLGYGGEVRILDYLPMHSTSGLVERIANGAAAP